MKEKKCEHEVAIAIAFTPQGSPTILWCPVCGSLNEYGDEWQEPEWLQNKDPA